MQVLMWLHSVLRPLKLEELQHALAVKGTTQNLMRTISLHKKNLSTAVLDCGVVRFVHYTLEEYFRDNARAVGVCGTYILSRQT